MDEDILNIYNNNNQHFVANSGTGGDDISIIVFINNIANSGGIMVLNLGSRMQLSNTLLIFQNNKCLTSANHHSGILLVLNAATLQSSDPKFTGNHSLLSGGITMISNSMLSITRSDVKFANNRGTDGGGIALYECSSISCHIGTCNMYFDNNTTLYRPLITIFQDNGTG